MKILITGAIILDAEGERMGDILVEDGVITRVEQDISCTDAEVFDARGMTIIPGVFDAHVHFRDPGFPHKEDFASGTGAAVAGGVTAIFDMPNTMPPTFTCEHLEQKRAIARAKAHCHYGLYFGAGVSNTEEIRAAKNIPGVKLYLNDTTGNLRMDDVAAWRSVMHAGKPVSLHAEGETFARFIGVWKEEGCPCRVYLCHMSLQEELELIRALKADAQTRGKVHCEVTPHHLLMTEKEREEKGALCCMKPPLATLADQTALWEGIRDGTIDVIGTDHAPHTLEEKQKDPPPYGIPGVETMLPLMLHAFAERDIPVARLLQMVTTNVRNIFCVEDKKGRIAPGYDADLVLLDRARYTISAQELHSRCGWTPFEDYPALGRVKATWVGGKIAYRDGEVQNCIHGAELRFGK